MPGLSLGYAEVAKQPAIIPGKGVVVSDDHLPGGAVIVDVIHAWGGASSGSLFV